MNLLEKFLAVAPKPSTREVHYGKLINVVPSAPALVNGENKAKVQVTLDFDGKLASWYMFEDSIKGIPTFIPKGGVNAMITLQQAEQLDKDGNPYINAVALGVGA